MSDKTPEREALEKEATDLEVKFAGNIGDEKLRERIEEAKAAQNGSGAANAAAAGGETSPQVTGNHAAPAVTQVKEPVAPPVSGTGLFEVRDRVRHNGTFHSPGDPIELDLKTEAPALIAAGVIAPPVALSADTE